MIDFTPILDPIIQLLAVVLMTIGVWAVRRLADKLGLDAEHEMVAMLDQVVLEAVSYGKRRARQAAKERGEVEITENELIESAAQYVLQQAPLTLTRLGVTEQALRERIEAWLGDDD